MANDNSGDHDRQTKREEEVRKITVAQGGSGDRGTVWEAIDKVLFNEYRTLICLSPEPYEGLVRVPKNKNFITFVGTGPEPTVLTWHFTSHTKIDSKEVTDVFPGWDVQKIWNYLHGTGDDDKGEGQGAALRVSSDRCAFCDCRFLGWQIST